MAQGQSGAGRAPVELPSVTRRIDRRQKNQPSGPITAGRPPGSLDLVLAGNDYLALRQDERLLESQINALAFENGGMLLPSVYPQFRDVERKLERRFADFLVTDASVMCHSGFAAAEGVIQSLADPDTPVYLDLFAHTGMWQGALAAKAPVHHFRHNDADHLREQIARFGPGIVGVDAIYATVGDRCVLADIVDVCEAVGAMLVVDESHAIGVIGPNGDGLAAELGLADRVSLRLASLAKAFVSRGGVVAGSARLCNFIRQESRSSIHSASMHPWEIARITTALAIVREEGWRRQRLAGTVSVIRRGLCDMGYDVSCSESQIIPLVAGPEARTLKLRDALENRGIFGAVMSAPVTPRNKSLVRLSLHAGLEPAHIERILDACRTIRDEVMPETWPSLTGQRRAKGLNTVVPLNGSTCA